MVSETFYPTPQCFVKAVCIQKYKKNGCPECKKGVLFSVPQPRIRWGLNQETYQCDKCMSVHVVQAGEQP